MESLRGDNQTNSRKSAIQPTPVLNYWQKVNDITTLICAGWMDRNNRQWRHNWRDLYGLYESVWKGTTCQTPEKTEIIWNLRWPIKMDTQFPDRTKTKSKGRVCYLWIVSCNQWHPPRVSTGPYTLRHIHKGPPRCTAKWLKQSWMWMTPRSTGEQTPQMDRICCKRTWTHCTNSQKPGNYVFIRTSVRSCRWGIDHRMAYPNSICMQERKMAA